MDSVDQLQKALRFPVCNLCNCQKLGDEYHYVFECSSLNDKRKQLLPKYFKKRHNVVKFFELLSTKKQSLLRKLCIFIKHINKIFCTPGLPTVVPYPMYISKKVLLCYYYVVIFLCTIVFGCMRIKIYKSRLVNRYNALQ